MTRRDQRRLRHCLVTVHRANGQSVRGLCESYSRRGIVLTRVEVEASGQLVSISSLRAIIPAEQVDYVTVEREAVA